jgi:2,4-dienoyl-CoA reductase-like NADH-dependent reductase (Old Yellow Enzyme family)
MVPWRATEDGFVTQRNLDWYRRFAEGRPAVLMVEATGVRDIPSGPLLRNGDDRFLPGLRKLVDVVKEASGGETLLFIQIIDFLSVKRRPERAKYFQRFLQIRDRHRQALASSTNEHQWLTASDNELRTFLANAPEDVIGVVLDEREREALDFGYRERVTDMHLKHIQELPRELPPIFASAAERAREAGFDGVGTVDRVRTAFGYRSKFIVRCVNVLAVTTWLVCDFSRTK